MQHFLAKLLLTRIQVNALGDSHQCRMHYYMNNASVKFGSCLFVAQVAQLYTCGVSVHSLLRTCRSVQIRSSRCALGGHGESSTTMRGAKWNQTRI
jgi:hypothetical protein